MAGVNEVVAKVSNSTFGQPLVTNIFRGHVAEAIVALALEPDWDWCSQDYASWDFEAKDGLRLEVKQSAAKQSWEANGQSRSSPRFDIRPRKFRWEGAKRIDEAGRYADIYVFAYHNVTDQTADHRDPEQWEFYIVPTLRLPSTKTISLKKLWTICEAVPFSEVRSEVELQSKY